MNMNIFKKTLFLVPALLLASCNFKYTYVISGLVNDNTEQQEEGEVDDAGTYNVKVWVDDKIVSLTQSQIQGFVNDNPRYSLNVTIEPVSEALAANNMLQDVQEGADIFVFAQDQLSRLKVAGALAKVTGSYATSLYEEMSEEAVQAATVNSDIYAFPITSDNGYFLYYDKQVVSDEQAKDMTSLLAACKAAGKTLNFEARSNGFYAASYFMATGCYSSWNLNSKTGKFESYEDNYNSTKGLIAAKGLSELDDKTTVAANSQASRLGNTSAACVSGIWEYETAESRLGKDRLGCAPLPSFTVDGESYHLSSFDGYKLLGVKPQVDPKKASVCRRIAKYLTSQACQEERFEQASWGPTNKKAFELPSVKAHKGLSALVEQHKYAKPQGQCPGSWFTALATTAKAITHGASDAKLSEILKNYEVGLPELLDAD